MKHSGREMRCTGMLVLFLLLPVWKMALPMHEDFQPMQNNKLIYLFHALFLSGLMKRRLSLEPIFLQVPYQDDNGSNPPLPQDISVLITSKKFIYTVQ